MRIENIVGFSFLVFMGIMFLLIVFLIQPFPLINYGGASTFGYMTTVEEGIFYDSVWIRSELESSQTDEYCIDGDTNLREVIPELIRNRERVELKFNKHVFGLCNDLAYEVEVTSK